MELTSILITGGYGFIGSEVVNTTFKRIPHLKQVVVLDRIDYCSRPNNILPEVQKDCRYKFIRGELQDHNLLHLILEDYHIDTVIHMAAQTHVDHSFSNPLKFTQDNVLGTHTLLEVCRRYGKIKRFIHMSTDEVYGEGSHDEVNPSHEKSLLDPTNPYAATKASAEFMVKSYGYSYNFPYIIIRGNNVYGHGQYPDKLIPKFSLYLHLGKKVPIHGQGTAKRTFVHVTDMANGILTVTLKGQLGEIYNIGSRNEYSVIEITKKLCEILNKDPSLVIEYGPDRNFNDQRYFIAYDKISALGWTEEVPFEQGLKDTIQWYIDRVNEYQDKI